MYETQETLASIDQNAWKILTVCAFAMICNYTWFGIAVYRGLRDKVYPMPVFCTLFWLCGDGAVVLSYDAMFNQIGHWYVKLFWAALTLTVTCELIFLAMILRFGREELAPRLSQNQFRAAVLGYLVGMATAWGLLRSLLHDDLFINYFHLANLAGPFFMIALAVRRGNRAGTSPWVGVLYTAMVASWFTATALWYGEPFGSPGYLAFYGVCTAAAATLALVVFRLPRVAQLEQSRL